MDTYEKNNKKHQVIDNFDICRFISHGSLDSGTFCVDVVYLAETYHGSVSDAVSSDSACAEMVQLCQCLDDRSFFKVLSEYDKAVSDHYRYSDAYVHHGGILFRKASVPGKESDFYDLSVDNDGTDSGADDTAVFDDEKVRHTEWPSSDYIIGSSESLWSVSFKAIYTGDIR